VFLSGKQFLEESNYDKAISYFKDAYSIDCSVHAMLPIIATAYERKGDMDEAIRALGQYLVRAPGAPDREVIEHRVRNLRDRLAHEQPPPSPAPTAVFTTPPTPTAAPPTPAPLPVASPSASPPIAPVSSPAEPTQSSGASPAPWVVASLGAAAVIGGVVTLVIGAGDVSNAQAACGANRQCPDTAAGNAAVAKGNDGRSLETVGGVVGGVGLALAAGGLIWHFTQGPATPAAATFTPIVAPGYAGVGIGGAF
jgi:tetratricopeptide (TPR) repeat protein